MRHLTLFVALSCLVAPGASAAPATVATMPSLLSQPVVLRDAASGRVDVVHTAFNLFPSSFVWDLWQTRSEDGGASWTAPVRIAPVVAPNIITSQRMSPSLVRTADSTLLVYQWYRGGAGTGLWQSGSTDGQAFPTAAPVELGWQQVAEQHARVVPIAGAGLVMLYQRSVGEDVRPPGLYLTWSSDNGASWDGARTLVAADAAVADRPALAVRPQDGRHVVAYTVDAGGGSRSIIVRTTIDASDWSDVPVPVAAAADQRDPSLSVLPDGAFLLVWTRADGSGGYDLVGRRSVDGADWSDVATLVAANGALLGSPFALAGASPDVVDLYWARTTSTDPLAPAGVIEHERVVVLDPVFADGFE